MQLVLGRYLLSPDRLSYYCKRHTYPLTGGNLEEGDPMIAKVEVAKCTGHGNCVSVCPVDAVHMEEGKAVIDEKCIECGACVASCPEHAISLD